MDLLKSIRGSEDIKKLGQAVLTGKPVKAPALTAADLLKLRELDQKLWVALACPTTGLEFDAATLALIDTDQDGRIRAPELIAAVKWAGACLKNPDDLLKGGKELPLSAINDGIVLDGELLAWKDGAPQPFNALQQRLARKKISAAQRKS